MALQLIRKMIVNEGVDSNCEPTGTLELLKMAPSKWLEDGKRIGVENMPTFFGAISLTVQSQLSQGKISGRFVAPIGSSLKKVLLWLRHPGDRPISAVTLNGQSQSDFSLNSIALPVSGAGEFEVQYQADDGTSK